MLFMLYSNLALAVPQQLTQQGRLLDSNDVPVEGVHNLSIQLYESPFSTNILWGESLSVTFNNGFYVVTLGADSTNALDSSILEEATLYVEMKIDNEPPLLPRTKISSSPYARMADVATNVEGGTINASEISINGTVVLDGSGTFVGEPVTPQWSDIQGVPSDFSDGVDNDSLANISCPSDDMVLSYTGGSWTCGYDDVLDSADVIAIIEGESDITVNLNVNSTVNGESIQTGTDQDTLGDLNCAGGEIPVYDPSLGWNCGTDNDTILTESEIINIVQSSSSLTLALSSSTTVDGNSILTDASTLEVDWNNVTGKPTDVTNGDSDTLDALNCSDGEIAIKQSGAWTCTEFSTLLDADGDGSLQWSDCDDGDASVGDSSNDGDCDGVVTTQDCDDSDATNTNTNVGDADCDGIATSADCDDSNANITTQGTGGSEDCAATSCKEILDNGISSGSDVYWINPNGTAFQAYCDMNTDNGGWTMLLNLDTSDGHVMWWANDLWINTNTYGDVTTPFSEDHKSQAFMDMESATEVLLVVHENGSYVGWKSFSKNGSGSLYSYLQGGDNTLLGSEVVNSDVGNVWSGERLVRISSSLYANHCVQTGGGSCTSNSTSSPDGDRIGSNEGTPSDNNGGGLGNWHDMHYCCDASSHGNITCNGGTFRTASEAQAGWAYSSQNGTFGSDSHQPMSGTQSNSSCSTANWASANGVDYDYAIFFR